MLKNYYYTDSEILKLCKSIVILIDTREQVNSHITEWFDKKKIPWKNKALSNGDYSFYIPANPKLNIDRDMFFDKELMIERKGDLDEIGSNFTKYRNRLEEELATFPGKKYLLLEKSTYGDVVEKKYRNDLSPKAFLASLHTFNHRYNWEIAYMPDPSYSGAWIYGTCYYYLKNILR